MNYSEFVRSKFKPGASIAAEMTPHKAAALQSYVMQAVRASDNLDAGKKYAIYNDDQYGLSALHFGQDRFKDFTITPNQAELLHAAIGIAGEAGELLDTVRKHVFDGQPLDRENAIEELGDLCFYMEAAFQAIGHDRKWVEIYNMAKLSKRYESGYSDKAAIERADKAGAE